MEFFLRLKQFFSMHIPRPGSSTDACVQPTFDLSKHCTEDNLPAAPLESPSTLTVVGAAEDGIAIHKVFAGSPAPNIKTGPHTTRNVLRLALETVSQASSNIPLGEILSSVINPLLEIADRIEQTSTNARGLLDLSERIALLGPTIDETAKIHQNRGRRMAEALKREIKSITETLKSAEKQNQLAHFFNSVETASVVANHNTALDRLIGDANFLNIHENMKCIREALLKCQSSPAAQFEARLEFRRPTIHGGVGGAGGNGGERGGKGGVGQGAQIQPDNAHLVSAIYGGVGGKGGDVDPACRGIGIGGDGGIGERGGIIEPIYLPSETVVRAGEAMPLPEFCAKFNISEGINDRLAAEGFSTAGALLGTSEGVFASCGLMPGHIGELRRALGEWKGALREKGEVD